MAADYINDPRFSQTFELAPDPDRGRTNPFKVKYADYGYRNEAQPNQENVFLFFGPLMGSRLMHIAKDEIAKRHKIRIINPDRPGMGGTDAVDASHTMSLWRGELTCDNHDAPSWMQELTLCRGYLGATQTSWHTACFSRLP